MSWDGLYKDRYYPHFNDGDEIEINDNIREGKYRFLTKGRAYKVIECFNPYTYLEESNVRKVKILNDRGFISEYASYNFKKTESQVREDKISSILE
jgi:hypothetical protein